MIEYSTDGTVIGGLTSGTQYYVTSVNENAFKLSQVGSAGR